ncbi:MAG TPA: M28 family peptidase [Mycobacteriales bacterium]|jgi:Zn-dependent M28 family amino/carboxypeptidase|nr:M28 family peptidase [Mycobacteriales bacterium]
MRPGKTPTVPGFAIEETTAREWTTRRVSVSAEIVIENRSIAIRNLIADIGKESPKPCFVAHYDSKPLTPGGNDNASGVAVLLALLQTWPADRPARFIFFDGEEAGLLGSHAYVEDLAAQGRLGEISFVVCPDSVGLGELHLYIADRFGPFPDDILARARRAFGEHDWSIPERAARSGGSDFRPFHELGVPCLFLSDFPNHVRHTAIDTADLINAGTLARLAAVLASKTLTGE